MSVEQTLENVEQDIAAKNYGKARDRLNGLIGAYPENLALRRQLGEIYWQLQYPAMAGRYWYLEEDKSPEMINACKTFEHSCGNNSYQILRSLKFQGDPQNIDSVYAKNTLQALQAQVQDEYGYTVDFPQRGVEKEPRTQVTKINENTLLVGCSVVALVAFTLMLIGLATALGWVF